MRFEVKREWLERRLAAGDDAEVAAGGMDLEKLKDEVGALTDTSGAQPGAGGRFGKVVRFIREYKRWSTSDLARRADIDEEELHRIESDANYEAEPRTVVHLAECLRLSKQKSLEVSGLMVQRNAQNDSLSALKFAANSKNVSHVTEDELDIIRALVAYLSEK